MKPMTKEFNKMFKGFKKEHMLLLLGSLALLFALNRQSNLKGMDGYLGGQGMPTNVGEQQPVLGQTSGVNGLGNGSFGSNASLAQKVVDPGSLLPLDKNSEWSKLNPQGEGSLTNVNLLQAGAMAGINTVSGSLRNASLDIRAEPPNPKMNVGPWQNTTIEHDDKYQWGLKMNC